MSLNVTHGTHVSLETGVQLKGVKKQPYIGRFFMIYADTLQRLLAEGEEAAGTVLFLASKVRYANQVYIRQAEIIRERKLARATVERHLAKAKELGLLTPDPKEADLRKGVRLWRLCPYLVWIGDSEERTKYLKALPVQHPFHAWKPADSTCES